MSSGEKQAPEEMSRDVSLSSGRGFRVPDDHGEWLGSLSVRLLNTLLHEKNWQDLADQTKNRYSC